MKLKQFDKIISGAWLQAEDESKVTPPSSFRKSFLRILDNELVKQGIECDWEDCKGHGGGVAEKYKIGDDLV